ncbi:MAG: ABC transporter permease [Oscillospiraceae bacterium]|nr:ABC transporter permease [Oscillospiraceae bacterium]
MRTILTLCDRNARAFCAEWKSHIVSLLAPFFFLYLFSEWFRSEHVDTPVPFMLVGLVVVEVFQFALWKSSAVEENVVGAPWWHVFAGQLLSVAAIAAAMGLIIYAIGVAVVGKEITSLWTVVAVVALILLLSLIFASVGLFLTCVIRNTKTREASITALILTLPFYSGAYVASSLLPELIQTLSDWNPLTYAVALFRAVSLELWNAPLEALLNMELAVQVGQVTITPAVSLLILTGLGLVFMVLSASCFARKYSKK